MSSCILSQLAQQHAQTYAGAQEKEAEAIADHVRQGQAQGFACRPDAAAAIAAYEGREQGRRGRPPRPWRYHTLRYGIVAASRRTRRTRRGRPAKTDPLPIEAGYRLVVEVDARLLGASVQKTSIRASMGKACGVKRGSLSTSIVGKNPWFSPRLALNLACESGFLPRAL